MIRDWELATAALTNVAEDQSQRELGRAIEVCDRAARRLASVGRGEAADLAAEAVECLRMARRADLAERPESSSSYVEAAVARARAARNGRVDE